MSKLSFFNKEKFDLFISSFLFFLLSFVLVELYLLAHEDRELVKVKKEKVELSIKLLNKQLNSD